MSYKTYTINNFRKIPQINRLSEAEKKAIEVVGSVLPFKANNYVVDELIDWNNYKYDPIFHLTFPQKDMLTKEHFDRVENLMEQDIRLSEFKKEVNLIRMDLNPNPAGQSTLNVPEIDGIKLTGIQHKYKETALFFPSQGQTCHAYCTFCFRWPQFVGIRELKFAMKESNLLIRYLQAHPEITDLIFTGGDPMLMKSKIFKNYMDNILAADIQHLKTIRIGSKALAYWPYRFLTDDDADDLLKTFEKVAKAGKNLSFMAHFNHPQEMETDAVEQATRRILNTGAQIRTQAPVMKHINDNADDWARMWRMQVDMGMIPYYMFIARDTGAKNYFGLSLKKCWQIYKKAYQQVSGICRTVRGPVMSSLYGKIQVLGTTMIGREKLFVLQFLQGRNPDWVRKPFFAEFDPNATWINDLKPAFGEEEFFFEPEFNMLFAQDADQQLDEIEIPK